MSSKNEQTDTTAQTGPNNSFKVTDEKITEFCTGCDNFTSPIGCAVSPNIINGFHNQRRVVYIRSCDQASVNGTRKHKSADGFKEYRQPSTILVDSKKKI